MRTWRDGEIDQRHLHTLGQDCVNRSRANQFRLFLHMGACWLLHLLRTSAPVKSVWHGATFETIRRTFVKVGVCVEELQTRTKLAFPASYPFADDINGMTSGLPAAAS